MEKEIFISGYCRVLDQSRMVELVTEEKKLVEVDCSFESCPYAGNCTVAQRIREIGKGEMDDAKRY